MQVTTNTAERDMADNNCQGVSIILAARIHAMRQPAINDGSEVYWLMVNPLFALLLLLTLTNKKRVKPLLKISS